MLTARRILRFADGTRIQLLRATLVNLHPTLIIPPIPEKHSMADYAAKPTKAKEDMGIIDLRKRMLSVFLNRCRKMKEVRKMESGGDSGSERKLGTAKTLRTPCTLHGPRRKC
jgi:hypothetical protein